MKGYKVLINNSQKIAGGISEGSTMILITFRDGQFRIFFNSMDETGMTSYTWYTGDLTTGDKITITYQDINENISPVHIVDYNNQEEINRIALQGYYRMREELIKEGVINF